jgi:hypothetical protein
MCMKKLQLPNHFRGYCQDLRSFNPNNAYKFRKLSTGGRTTYIDWRIRYGLNEVRYYVYNYEDNND